MEIINNIYNVEISNYDGFNIVRDDVLFGGTKERLLNDEDFLQKMKDDTEKYKTIMYTGNYGYGLVVAGMLAKKLNKKCKCVVNKVYMNCIRISQEDWEKSIVYKKLKELEVEIVYSKNWKDLISMGKELKNKDVYWLPLGLDSEISSDCLSKNISKSFETKSNVKNIWVVAGTGCLAESLCKAFPLSNINCIILARGKKYEYVRKRLQKFKNARLYNVNNIITYDTPYPSVEGYDKYSWTFAKRYGNKGDYIWNTAK